MISPKAKKQSAGRVKCKLEESAQETKEKIIKPLSAVKKSRKVKKNDMSMLFISNIYNGSKNVQITSKSAVKCKLFVKIRLSKTLQIIVNPEQFVRNSQSQENCQLFRKGVSFIYY